MKITTYLTLDELLHLHERLLERDGGSAGVRDRGLVEAALARPRSGYYETLSAQAAALLQSLTTGHAFVDGNKRVGFAACSVFLVMNGYRMSVSADAAEEFLVAQVIGNHAEVDTIAAWLEARMVPIIKPGPKTKKR